MIRRALQAFGLLTVSATFTFASTIDIPASLLSFSVFSQFGDIYNNHYATPGTTIVYNGKSVNGYNAFGVGYGLGPGSDPITYSGGGSTQTHGFGGPGTLYGDYADFVSAVSAAAGTPLSSWVGVTPGVYEFETAPTTLNLTAPGKYIFKYTGSTELLFNDVNITLGGEISSDDVIWYIPKPVQVNAYSADSKFAGVLLATGDGASINAIENSLEVTGRVFATSIIGMISRYSGGDLSFQNQVSSIPEPATSVLLFSALAVGVFARKRLNRQ